MKKIIVLSLLLVTCNTIAFYQPGQVGYQDNCSGCHAGYYAGYHPMPQTQPAYQPHVVYQPMYQPSYSPSPRMPITYQTFQRSDGMTVTTGSNGSQARSFQRSDGTIVTTVEPPIR